MDAVTTPAMLRLVKANATGFGVMLAAGSAIAKTAVQKADDRLAAKAMPTARYSQSSFAEKCAEA